MREPGTAGAVYSAMPKNLSIDHARIFCQALRTDASDAAQWHRIAPIAASVGLGDPAVAIATAVEVGWLEVADGRRVRLTDKGSYLD